MHVDVAWRNEGDEPPGQYAWQLFHFNFSCNIPNFQSLKCKINKNKRTILMIACCFDNSSIES